MNELIKNIQINCSSLKNIMIIIVFTYFYSHILYNNRSIL